MPRHLLKPGPEPSVLGLLSAISQQSVLPDSEEKGESAKFLLDSERKDEAIDTKQADFGSMALNYRQAIVTATAKPSRLVEEWPH